jgi:crotonobetainyl-CoA:carnitine CoA-transferase CaiB-like acyl-CoA transferase
LSKQNPALVYLAVSAFGPQGPWAHRPAADLPAQLSSETTASLGVTGEEPVRVGTDVGGMYAAIYGVQAVCAALWERETSGLGQRVDVSLFGSLIAMRSTLWVALSNPDEWWGFHLDSYAKPPDHGYQCADLPIYFSLARMDRDSMSALLVDLDMPWVRDDPLFPLLAADTGGGTGRHAHEVHHLWERGFAKWPADQVMATIERHGGIAFPMNDYARLVAQPQVQETGVLARIPGGNETDEFTTISPPWEFSDTPASIRRRAPALGEHTAEIQSQLQRREKVGPA